MATVTFCHSGRIGDLLYSLYFARDIIQTHKYDEAVFYIKLGEKDPGNVPRLTQASAEWLKPLIEASQLFSSVQIGYNRPTGCIDLDCFRRIRPVERGDNIMWYYDSSPEVLPMHIWEPVIQVTPSEQTRGRLIVTRTPRYHCRQMDYNYIKKYSDRAVFIGSDDEYRDFCSRFFYISRCVCHTALECAEAMAGSAGVVVNQGGLCALAECLKIPRVMIEGNPNVVHPIGGEFKIAATQQMFNWGIDWLGSRTTSYKAETSSDRVAIFCTHSQFKQEIYTARIVEWRKSLDFLSNIADFYTIVDGKLTADNKEQIQDLGITVIECTPWLGRKTLDDFQGWKRSYGIALVYLSSKYNYITHIENDVLIQNTEKVLDFIKKPGLYSGWLHNANYIESAFQILNEPLVVQELGNNYSRKQFYADGKCFEHCLKHYNFDYPFSLNRVSGCSLSENVDILTNYRSFMNPVELIRGSL